MFRRVPYHLESQANVNGVNARASRPAKDPTVATGSDLDAISNAVAAAARLRAPSTIFLSGSAVEPVVRLRAPDVSRIEKHGRELVMPVMHSPALGILCDQMPMPFSIAT